MSSTPVALRKPGFVEGPAGDVDEVSLRTIRSAIQALGTRFESTHHEVVQLREDFFEAIAKLREDSKVANDLAIQRDARVSGKLDDIQVAISARNTHVDQLTYGSREQATQLGQLASAVRELTSQVANLVSVVKNLQPLQVT